MRRHGIIVFRQVCLLCVICPSADDLVLSGRERSVDAEGSKVGIDAPASASSVVSAKILSEQGVAGFLAEDGAVIEPERVRPARLKVGIARRDRIEIGVVYPGTQLVYGRRIKEINMMKNYYIV